MPSHNKNKTKRLQQNNDKNAEAQLTDSFGEDLPKGSTPTTRPRTTKTALSRTRTGWINDHRQLRWKEMQSWTMYRTKLRQSEKTWPAYRSYSKGRQSKSSSLIAARKSRLPMCRNECAIPEAEWFFYFHFLIRNVIIVKRLVGKQLRLH